MKVGIIGLGRMGEGMSRRMIKQGIETVGYRRNYDKAKQLQEDGGISEAVDSLETLVRVVKRDKLQVRCWHLSTCHSMNHRGNHQ